MVRCIWVQGCQIEARLRLCQSSFEVYPPGASDRLRILGALVIVVVIR